MLFQTTAVLLTMVLFLIWKQRITARHHDTRVTLSLNDVRLTKIHVCRISLEFRQYSICEKSGKNFHNKYDIFLSHV